MYINVLAYLLFRINFGFISLLAISAGSTYSLIAEMF